MSEQNNGEKKERRFSQEQYDMLMRCSEANDMTEWNEWRAQDNDVEVLLEGADLRYAQLQGANLWDACLEGAVLMGARLEGAKLSFARLKGANLCFAHMEGANLRNARMEGANLWAAHLEGAVLWSACLNGAVLWWTFLKDANFEAASVDGETLIWDCKFDRSTLFYGVGLRSARVEPKLRAELEANNRRHKWEEWYEKNRKWKKSLNPLVPIIKAFWWMSDYGRSAPKVIGTFFSLATMFAVLYCIPGLVEGLYATGEVTQVAVPWWMIPFRALYFSIVTMTTLGFGDVVAGTQGIAGLIGHILLTFQVLLGYVMLAALVSRLAVLFQEG